MTDPVKAFLLFVGETYYPGEGVQDLVCSADTVEELQAELPARLEDGAIPWWQIVEHRTMRVLLEGCVPSHGPPVVEDHRG